MGYGWRAGSAVMGTREMNSGPYRYENCEPPMQYHDQHERSGTVIDTIAVVSRTHPVTKSG